MRTRRVARTVGAAEVRHEHDRLGALLKAVVDRGHGAVDAAAAAHSCQVARAGSRGVRPSGRAHRAVLVITEGSFLSCGTLKSTRMRTRLPATSRLERATFFMDIV